MSDNPDTEELKKQLEVSLLEIAALMHFALVHDIVDYYPIGSTTGIRLCNAWTKIPEYIRKKFPDIAELAKEVKAGKPYSVPTNTILREAMEG